MFRGTYRYLLFATLALLPNGISPGSLAAIVLAHPERDGLLTMNDILELGLNADFVTLSACDTGRKQERPGAGISGLTRAFV